MIHIRRVAEPKELDLSNSKSRGYKELQRAKKYFLEKEKDFPFRVYKAPNVKNALDEMFHGKCGYCESKIDVVTHVDVEHFRPKGAIIIEDNEDMVYPGYYWLAMKWENLLISCPLCNREHKGNQFPLVDESLRVKSPLDNNLEEALLLNPCEDNPTDHLIFTESGEILTKNNSDKGETSIKIYGLYRPKLTQARAEVAKEIILKMVQIYDDLEDIGFYLRHQDDPEFEKKMSKKVSKMLELYNLINEYINNSENPYLAMVIQITSEFISEYDEVLSQLKNTYISKCGEKSTSNSS